MTKDMDSLQNAEKELENLQKQLEQAKQEQEHVVTEKQILEKQLQETHSDSGNLHTTYSDLEISQLKAEIEVSDENIGVKIAKQLLCINLQKLFFFY